MAQSIGSVIIDVKADTQKLVAGFDRAEKTVTGATQKMTTGINLLATAFAGIQVAELTKSLITQADSWTNINNRLRLATSSEKELLAVQKEVIKVAQTTRTDLTATATLYERIARSTRNYNIENKELVDLTTTINKSMVISGGTAESMTAAIIQLGQAFSADFKAVGQELASIREQTPRLYQAILDGTGETTQSFRKLAEEGKLSSEIIIKALQDQAQVVADEFIKMNVTVGQAMTTLRNSVLVAVGTLDEGTDITQELSLAIVKFSQTIDANRESLNDYADAFGDLVLVIASLTIGTKAYNAVQTAVNGTMQLFQTQTANTTKLQNLNTEAMRLGTQAVTARKLADEAGLVAQKSGLAMAQAQYTMLNKQAIALETQAQKATASAYAYEANAKSMTLMSRAAGVLRGALSAIPHVALSVGIFALIDYLMTADEEMVDLTQSTDEFAESLKKLSQNEIQLKQLQLTAQIETLKTQLEDATNEVDKFQKLGDSYMKQTNVGFVGMKIIDEKEYLKSNVELEKIQNNLIKATKAQELLNEQSQLMFNNAKEIIEEGNIKKIGDDLFDLLYPLEEINKKYDSFLKQLEGTKDNTPENIAKINQLRQEEIDKLTQKSQVEDEAAKKAEQALKAQQQAYSNFLQITGSDYEKWLDATNQKMIELASSGTLTAEQLQLAFDSMQKEYNVEIKAKVTELEIEQIEQDYSAIEQALDYQMQLIDSADAWGNTLDGVAGDILNIVGAYNKVEKAALGYQKDQLKADEKLALARAKYGKDSIELIEAEQTYQLESTRIKEAQQQSEVDGYANITGAYSSMAGSIASMAEEGSTAAKVATIAQQALAVASGVASILNQGSGDPYSAFARIAAMTALVVSTLASAGVSFSGSSVGQTDFASEVPSWTQTTVLGAKDETSQSIANSLETLEDFASPEFGVLSEMRNYLENIDKNLVAVGADVIRTGEFALGVGAKEFQQSWANDPEIFSSISSVLDPVFGGAFDPLAGLLDSVLGAFGLGGGGYTWQQLTGSGISFGSNATAGNSYTASESHYLKPGSVANSLQDTTAQTLDDLISNIDALLYQTTAREDSSKNFWGSASYSYSSTTAYQKMQQELANSLTKTFVAIQDSILTGSEILNRDIEDKLGKQLVDIGNIDLSQVEDAEELNKLLNTEFSEQADKFISSLYGASLEDFQAVGEGLYETFIRVSAGIGEADYYIKRLGNSFDSVDFEDIDNKYGDVALEALRESITEYDEAIYGINNGVVDLLDTVTTSAEDIYNTYMQLDDARLLFDALSLSLDGLSQSAIVGTDGLDNLTSSLDVILNEMLSEAEQAEYIYKSVNSEFAKLGLETPQSVEDYLGLIQGIDTSDEAGQELLGRILAIADSFTQLAEVIENSDSNIKAFTDTFKTQEQILEEQAETLGLQLATSLDELLKQFGYLQSDTAGLTDDELSYLTSVKELLDEQTENQTNTLTNILTSLDSTISSLRNSASSEQYSLDTFYKALLDAEKLAQTDDYTAFEEALSEVTANASALQNQDLFSDEREMLYAQSVAANRLEAISDLTYDELDYLEQIANNTDHTTQAILEYFENLEKNNLPTDLTFEDFKLIYNDKVVPFAQGGIVTSPTVALIGEAGYDEAVIPLNNTDYFGIGELIREFQNQRNILNQQNSLLKEQNLYLRDVRDINNSSYLQLETIGGRI